MDVMQDVITVYLSQYYAHLSVVLSRARSVHNALVDLNTVLWMCLGLWARFMYLSCTTARVLFQKVLNCSQFYTRDL